MAANKWMKELNKMEGAADIEYSPYLPSNVLRSTSPYLNWIFGKGSGLPFGFGALLYGPPKSGKSLLSYLMAAGLHAQDKDAIVVKFNTELREGMQGNSQIWNIDQSRYQGYDVNEPALIFDRIKDEFLPLLQQGMPLKLLIIDSLREIVGVKEMTKESITNHLMGDHAATIQNGLKMILPIIRKYKIALVCTEHIRGNFDAGSYGPKEKMAGGWGEKHFFEYYVEVKRNNSAEGKANALGEKFENDSVKDARGEKERTGHKIYAKMSESSGGVAGRSGIFTLDYNKGLINVEEEIFELAKNLNLVERPNNRTYVANGKNYSSKEEFITAIKNDPELAKYIVEKAYARDSVA